MNVANGSSKSFDGSTVVPVGARRIQIYRDSSAATLYLYVYEIGLNNEPIITANSIYMLLHLDPTKSIKSTYQKITISYFSTSAQRLYRIGTEGNWLDYQDQPITLNNGYTIYAKGIDKYGKETRIISSHTASVPDAIGTAAIDGDFATYYLKTISTASYLNLDSSLIGNKIRVKLYATLGQETSKNVYFRFLGDTLNVISTPIVLSGVANGSSKSYDGTITVPAGAKYIQIYRDSSAATLYLYIYDIKPL